ncbi:hypothetical protein [Halarcobacter ebronensis]|uniref:Uncharacterized protein n=1 Tax=Halarcobacter ebronensis TaxID=1462615 RepID=A0A4Q1AQ79_9BACT|nr:hypothetical protein [Halarcobacter ebronensis]QKF81507.1 hypothetical protein AEBR_1010 [Halarcobacter ebronensis]RXK05438.1 hypothetical protein CRV07_07960 [Halarcobacter ebronensis]
MKNILLICTLIILFVGCTINRQPQTQNDVEQTTKDDITENSLSEDTEIKPTKKISYTYYRIIPSKIEVFPYNNLYNTTLIDDKKIKNSFYVEGNKIRIERVYTSAIGDKYGKIAGKDLIVSMDDLTDYK